MPFAIPSGILCRTVSHIGLINRKAPSNQSELNHLPQKQAVVLDKTGKEAQIFFGQPHQGMKLLLLGEAVGALFLSIAQSREYDHYVVMLVAMDKNTIIAQQLGIGTIPKTAWYATNAETELVVLRVKFRFQMN